MTIKTIGRPKGYQYPVGLSTILVTLGTNSNVILEYTSSNTWVAPDNVTEVEYLVVGGGGGGGGSPPASSGGGGGGAGGFRIASGFPIVAGNTYTVTIGSGGGAGGSGNRGGNGSSSIFSSVTSAGGGGGGGSGGN